MLRVATLTFVLLCAIAAHAADVVVLVKPGASLNGPSEFPTIQNAIDHAPQPADGGRVVLRITPGVYKERLWIPRNRPRMTLLGLGNDPSATVITSDHYAASSGGTFFTETVEINGDDFEADNVTFANTAGRVGQALAVSVLSDRAIFKHCRFLGNQDTLFANWGRQYYLDSYVEGTVDYVFGNAAAVFERVEFHTLAPGFITAQSRLSSAERTGFIIRNSRLTLTAEAAAGKGVALGRPWRPFSRVVFLNTWIDAGLVPAGFVDWSSTSNMADTFYAEVNSAGPGANPAGRSAAMKHPSPLQLQSFATREFLGGNDAWNPEAEAARLP